MSITLSPAEIAESIVRQSENVNHDTCVICSNCGHRNMLQGHGQQSMHAHLAVTLTNDGPTVKFVCGACRNPYHLPFTFTDLQFPN